MHLDTKRGGELKVKLFDKRSSFPFSIVRISGKSISVLFNIVYFATDTKSLRSATASTNLDSFSTAIKPLVAHISRGICSDLGHLLERTK